MGGSYNEAWTGSGTTHAIKINGFEILSKGDGTYCNGFTFTVVTDVGKEAGSFEGASLRRLRTFQRMWYGDYTLANAKNEKERAWMEDVRERQLQAALPWMKIGAAVDLIELRSRGLRAVLADHLRAQAQFPRLAAGGAGRAADRPALRSSQKDTGVANASERFRDWRVRRSRGSTSGGWERVTAPGGEAPEGAAFYGPTTGDAEDSHRGAAQRGGDRHRPWRRLGRGRSSG